MELDQIAGSALVQLSQLVIRVDHQTGRSGFNGAVDIGVDVYVDVAIAAAVAVDVQSCPFSSRYCWIVPLFQRNAQVGHGGKVGLTLASV